MAAEILTQPTNFHTEGSTSFAEFGVLYGEKGVAEAQFHLQIVLEFKSIRPKTVQLNGRRVPSPAVDELARKVGASTGTLWRWYRLYRSAYASAQGNVHAKAKAGFEALIPRQRGRTEDSCEDRRYKVDEELRRAIAGLYARRKRPSITKVWRKAHHPVPSVPGAAPGASRQGLPGQEPDARLPGMWVLAFLLDRSPYH